MKKGSVKYNFLMNLIYNIALYIFPLITYPYVARVLSPEGIGKVTFAQSFSAYFAIVAGVGLTTYANRGVALNKKNKSNLNKFVTEILTTELICTTVVFFIYLIVVFKFPFLAKRRPELLIMAFNIFTGGFPVDWLYMGLERFDLITKRFIVCKPLSVLLLFITVRNADDFLWYAVFTFSAYVAVNIWNIITMHKYVTLDFSTHLNIFKHLKKSVAFWATTIANCIYTNLDGVMLTAISGDIQTGFYSTALKIRLLLTNVILSLARVLLPRISYELANDNEKEVNRILQKAVHVTVLASLYFAIFSFVFAEDIMVVFAGNEFVKASSALRWILVSVVVYSISALFTEQIFPAYGMEKTTTLFIGIGVIVDLVLNLVLMKKWGAAGGAAATFLTEVSVFALSINKARKLNNKYFKELSLKRIAALMVITAGVAYVFEHFIEINLIIKILISGISYSIVFYIILLAQGDTIAKNMTDKVVNKIKGYKKAE